MDTTVQYIIDVLPDDTGHKMILDGARNFSELKERLRVYEQVRKSIQETWKEKEEWTVRADWSQRGIGAKEELIQSRSRRYAIKRSAGPKRCFNCGEREHRSANCMSNPQGNKCIKCNHLGHVATECN